MFRCRWRGGRCRSRIDIRPRRRDYRICVAAAVGAGVLRRRRRINRRRRHRSRLRWRRIPACRVTGVQRYALPLSLFASQFSRAFDRPLS